MATETVRKPRVVASGVDGWWARACWPHAVQQGPSWAWYPTWREAVDAALAIGYPRSEEAVRAV